MVQETEKDIQPNPLRETEPGQSEADDDPRSDLGAVAPDVTTLEDDTLGAQSEDLDGEEEAMPERPKGDPERKRSRSWRAPRDERAEGAFTFLKDVLTHMGMEVSVRRRRPRQDSSPDEIFLEIVGRDAGRVIGKKGRVLAALQYLVNRVTNRPSQPRRHVVLDAEGYRHRRETSLATMARRLSEQAVNEGKIVTFEPMSARDRRVVHLALAKLPDVVTRSDGDGEERRVRIIPVRR